MLAILTLPETNASAMSDAISDGDAVAEANANPGLSEKCKAICGLSKIPDIRVTIFRKLCGC